MFSAFTSSIARRLYALIVIFAIGFAGVLAYQLYTLRENLDAFKRTELQSVVQGATSIAQTYYDRAQAGEFSEEEAKTLALETLRGFRYQGSEYVFVDTFDMVLLMHPTKPEKQGSNRAIEEDGRGKLFIKEMVTNAKANGSTFVTYLFKSPDGGSFDKISYAQAFEPWGWTIASGVLMTQVDAIFTEAATISGIIAFGVTLLLLVIGIFIARSISKPLAKLNNDMVRIAGCDFDVVPAGMDRPDEIGDMARAVEVFRANGLKVSEMTEEERAASIQRRAERTDMMVALQAAFGEVVDAAIAGDFSKRVHAEFPDQELNALAGSVNSLVETVDRGINETGEVLDALANTDLTKRMHGDYQGAFAKLKEDTNRVADKLTDVVRQLRDTSRTLKTATGEILSGANDLSERTTKQAATIEETSAAMEQLAGTVAENARMAESASGNAQTVSQKAAQSGETMSQANVAMERITQSSAKISNIIGMIDDIAFQTNLLALNASVEAARAGDAGKGFAVVAVEVRRLAQSAASASSDVKALIEQSANEVTGGSKLVSNAAEQLSAMLNAVEENATLMVSIAKASREQAAAIDEVTVAVRTLDEMTQHNAALVEETNAAIEQTEGQANELDQVVAIFTTGDELTGMQQGVRSRIAPAQRKPAAKAQVKQAAKAYLSDGNAAIAADWDEF
ncbi:methyl-accepting chemotaxis protein [Devosia sp. RR2S18]|uniref:methyl-accepting chemotaxis protein n=1 Tax=Devosia rhizosphaerae TaxID=3049774 RepID=UPI002541E04C|nr:methyl-accepting chemotaxis protein [Devosia sp. RR2S18]WIJ25577.1 methyl-accepting chemotaxis protein [Devosia sp. RR2S18]